MTSILESDKSPVYEATEDDMRAALEDAVEKSGFSYHELEKQAEAGHFESLRARMAWVAIGNLGRFAVE